MKHPFKRIILQLCILLNVFALNATPSSFPDIEPVEEWTEYTTIDGVLIEYKYQSCNNENVKNQVLVLFRYSNQNNSSVELSWQISFDMNGSCANCERLTNDEYNHHLVLGPNEIKEGTGSDKLDKRMYLFSNFVTKVPGMSDKKLTDFQFLQLEVNPSTAQ